MGASSPCLPLRLLRRARGVVLITGGTDEGDLTDAKREPPDLGSEAGLCLWWRRGGVEPPVQKAPRWDVLQA